MLVLLLVVKMLETIINFPLNIEPDSVKVILNFIDVEKLGKLAYINPEGLKAVRLNFKFDVSIKFKKLETVVPFLIQYTITNDIDKMQKILKAVVEQISNSIIKFFNEKLINMKISKVFMIILI
ncbi:hypothetical protein SCITRI_001299 [Spiroplasma citri]|nr:hypothetical protein [Spiroplasma citri]APE75176.1 hypothetical protein SCITRI_001299 [Spiroplasma citri]